MALEVINFIVRNHTSEPEHIMICSGSEFQDPKSYEKDFKRFQKYVSFRKLKRIISVGYRSVTPKEGKLCHRKMKRTSVMMKILRKTVRWQMKTNLQSKN